MGEGTTLFCGKVPSQKRHHRALSFYGLGGLLSPCWPIPSPWRRAICSTLFFVCAGWTMIRADHAEGSMALFDDMFVVLPLAYPILRPLAKTAVKGGILAYRGAAG